MLIIALPHTSAHAATGYAHVHSDGHSVTRSATGAAATLSAHAGEVVAVVPHSRMSWLSVQLPPASHGPRLMSVLHGLLEDRLLDDPQQLHLVLPPNSQALARTGGTTWVAACDKTWLREALAPLHAAGLTVQRLVPELQPTDTPTLHVVGEPDQSVSVLTQLEGVSVMPTNAASWRAFQALNNGNTDAQNDTALQIYAEPAMVARVQSLLQRQPVLQSAAQRWVAASQSAWDLAQGEWAQGRSQRLQRGLQSAWQTLAHAPAWRAVRVGIAALVLLQIVGLNALAWREKSALDQQQQALQRILKTSFPAVSLVIDAPLQMQREVDALQQKSGHVSRTDLEPLLAALAGVLPAGQVPTQLHFVNAALRVHSLSLDDKATQSAQANLKTQGLSWRQEANNIWVLQAEARP
ncbi:type II secretion system protein GspL [Limnohabitans sp. B9-3]|uniref:type II secretion system protein GspL n=1 Tax=Limnohabitans sp. B9-3 TaxID=1100707 RepID=UPI00130446C0|nr:type II secretion system protein GspL [Limnohabitans sp. B9-3]